MTTEVLAPSPAESLFCASLPSMPKAWDSTMLGLLKDCPRKFQYIILDGWSPHGFAAHLAFGIAYHKALETYDKDKAQGLTHDQALLEAVRFCMTYGTRTEDGAFVPYDSAFTGEPAKTRETLVRAVVWYLEQFKDDPAKTIILKSGLPAVEHSFKVELDFASPDGDAFLLCGHLDRLVELDGSVFWLDRKTTKTKLDHRFWRQFTGPHNQFSLYTAATQLVLHKPARGGIIDAVELGATYARFARQVITKTPGQQAEWLNDAYHWIGLAMQWASDGYWPMNESSCSKYGGCPFLSICSKDPKVRQGFLEHEGFKKQQWNPLESR